MQVLDPAAVAAVEAEPARREAVVGEQVLEQRDIPAVGRPEHRILLEARHKAEEGMRLAVEVVDSLGHHMVPQAEVLRGTHARDRKDMRQPERDTLHSWADRKP